MKHHYYPSLDGLRTVAVGIVLCAHGGVPYFRSGGVGVDVFFVLSGFLITTILASESAATGTVNFRNFYARRFLRLAPALVLTCALVGLTKPWFGGGFPATDIALSLSYTANWALALYGYHLTWLNHCWSLAIEEQFYILWPVLIVVLERTVRHNGPKVALLLVTAAALAVRRTLMVGTWTDERINFGLDARMDTLIVGAALCYLVRCMPEGKWPAPVSRVLGYALAPLAAVGLFAVINTVTWYSPWMGWIGYVLVAGAAALVIGDVVGGSHSLLARVLASRPMVAIGKISYGLYLFHLPVYYMVEALMPAASLPIRLAVKVTVSLALAKLSFELVERRCLQLKAKFETPSRAPGRDLKPVFRARLRANASAAPADD